MTTNRLKGWRRRSVIRRIALRDGWDCWWCDLPLTILTATLDHLICISSGGSNHIDNQVLACEPCNNTRGNQPSGEFFAQMRMAPCPNCGMWHIEAKEVG